METQEHINQCIARTGVTYKFNVAQSGENPAYSTTGREMQQAELSGPHVLVCLGGADESGVGLLAFIFAERVMKSAARMVSCCPLLVLDPPGYR